MGAHILKTGSVLSLLLVFAASTFDSYVSPNAVGIMLVRFSDWATDYNESESNELASKKSRFYDRQEIALQPS